MTRDRGSVQDDACERNAGSFICGIHQHTRTCVLGCFLGVLFDFQRAVGLGYPSSDPRGANTTRRNLVTVELNGIEPMTSGLQSRRSPS